MRMEQHWRELPERQALLDEMRPLLEEEMTDPRTGESDQTFRVSFDERTTVLFEEKWWGWCDAFLMFDAYESLADLKELHREWHEDPGNTCSIVQLAQVCAVLH